MSFGAHLQQIRHDRNWLATGNALVFLSDGLGKYAKIKMKELHAKITTSVGGPTVVCSCKSTPGTKLNPHGPACVWAQELKKFHVFKKKADIPWHQSDSSKWHDPVTGYWEIAKLFMSDLGSDSANVLDPDSTDVGPLLHLFRCCKYFKVQKSLLKAVTDWRNKWAHAPKHKLTDGQKNAVFQDIRLLIKDPELLSSKEVQNCKPKVKKVEVAELSILEENLLRLIEECRRIKESENLQEKLDAANKEIKFLRKTVSSLVSIIMGIFTFLLFLMSVVLIPWQRIPSLLQWGFAVFFIFSYVGDKNGRVSDDGCASAMMKSPISHLNFQQFDFSSILDHKREGFVGRKWFFIELDNIFETDRETTGVLITGDPGSGKSALLSQLICSPYSSLQIHQNIIGYHFCEYSEKGKRDGARFVRNLVDQIAARLPGYSELIVKNELIRRELQGTLCEQDITGCFVTSILGPLRALQPQNGLRYIVIDALDECFETDKTSEIVEVLSTKIPHFPKWLKVILTSRNLTMVTKKIPRLVRRTALYASHHRNVEDIRFYVSHFISQNSFFVDRLSTAMNFRSTTYDMKIFLDEVIKRAEGNFLFVKMALQYMNDTDGMVGLRVLPTSLFDLYNIFFGRQFGIDGFGPFRSLFEILLSVCSPLQLNDVEEILRNEYEEGNVFQLIEQASCFLQFGHDGTVRIYHQSFAEWLINQSAVIHINETRAHQNIATFQIRRISKRQKNATIEEVIELFMHILAGNTLEKHGNTIDLHNITEMREKRTNQTILHHLATKPRPFLPVLDFFLPKFKTVDVLDANKKTPAFSAASEGLVENLRGFINRGADVGSFLEGVMDADPFVNVGRNASIAEYSLIHAAAAKGHKDVVELLIKSNVTVDEVSKKYPTPLHLAAENGHLAVLRLFYDTGTKFDVITLHHGAARNHSDVVEFLLETVGIRDSCLECICKPEDLSKFGVHDVHLYFCETALHAAVSRGYTDIVKILLAFGNESLECKHHSGKTALMLAVERNNLEMVDLLLANGANVTATCGSKIPKQTRSKICPLYLTYKQDFLYTVYCIENSCKCGNTAIHESAKYGFWMIAEKLNSKKDFGLTDVRNCGGEHALNVAISHGHTHFIYHTNETYKIQNYVLVDSAIVHFAVQRHSNNAVRHILSYPINYIYQHTWELLLQSFDWSPYDQYMTGVLNPTICPEIDEYENLSLEEWIQAVSKKSLAVTKLLIGSYKPYEETSFFLDKKDEEGMTLLHKAIKNGFEDAVKYLVESGVDTKIKNKDGDCPLTFALKLYKNFFPKRDVWYRCYVTSDGKFGSCKTTSHDEIVRYLIWTERARLLRCDTRSAFLLNKIIEKQMPLSLYELLKAGVDMDCQKDKSLSRPFLQHLRLGGRELSEVFMMFEVEISLKCGTSFLSSELHLISRLAQPDALGNFFKPLRKHRSSLQRLIDKHPKIAGVLDTCYDDKGFLPIHHAAYKGNLDAVKWFNSIGANTQLESRGGGTTALDFSIERLEIVNKAELLASSRKTTLNVRKAVFEELLRTFFSTRPDFLCNPIEERLSPLHKAAATGTTVLTYVHKKASEIFRNLPLNCVNKKHRIDTVYRTHFESLLQFGYTDIYLKDVNYSF